MNSRNYVEIERALARIPRIIIANLPLCAIEVMRIFFFLWKYIQDVEKYRDYSRV